MSTSFAHPGLRFEKHRAHARIVLTGGREHDGWFFVAGAAARHGGRERIADLLESNAGFVPFEMATGAGVETRLINPRHLVYVVLGTEEVDLHAEWVGGRRQPVTLWLSNGTRLVGVVYVDRPEGHDRLSDWTRQPDTFRYVESSEGLLLVNAAHVVDLTEADES